MLTPRDARDIVLKTVRPARARRVPLGDALGRCLAEDIRADRDLPPADRSAMDGYAVRAADMAELPCSLRLVGEVAAGSPSRPRVVKGSCARILTGANVPPGADTVVMVEKTSEADGIVTITSREEPRANVLFRGEDARKGAVLVEKGTTLKALQAGVCAMVGKATPKVHGLPSITIICTGEELRRADETVRRHQQRNSNGPVLSAAMAAWGFPGAAYQIAPDDLGRLVSKLKKAVAKHDVVLLTGGVSVGKYDLVAEAVEKIGAAIRFHGVAMKPGKPVLYATLPRNRHIFGLPGNPLSSLAGFHEFVLPALRRLSGVPASMCCRSLTVPLASKALSKGKRIRMSLARLVWGDSGPEAEPIRSMSSSDMAAAGRADGVIVIPKDVKEIPAGSLVEFRPWRPLP